VGGMIIVGPALFVKGWCCNGNYLFKGTRVWIVFVRWIIGDTIVAGIILIWALFSCLIGKYYGDRTKLRFSW
jgi:hypothetical protein